MAKNSNEVAIKAVVAFVILFGVLAVLHQSGTIQPAPQTAASAAVTIADNTPAAPVEIPISDISWQTIDAIYNVNSGETDLSKNEKWKEFQGKKVRWTGIVRAVADSMGSLTMQVKMNPDTVISDLIVYLEDSQRKNALLLKEGDSVTFTGILDEWGSILQTTLKHGVIEKAERAAPTVADSTPAPPPFDWDHAPQGKLAAAAYLDEGMIKMRERPQEGTVYFGGDLQIIQKVDRGYIVGVFDPNGDTPPTGTAFVETDQEFEAQEVLAGAVRYIGLYSYTAVDGFDHSIYRFQLHPNSRAFRP
jgi:hypothetical protein